jgi:hypothetical protein
MLLRVYVVTPKLERGIPDLVSACKSGMLMLSRQPDRLEAIIHHPVCTLWAECNELLYDQMPNVADDYVSIRYSSWRRVPKFCVVSRLATIHKFLLSKSNLEKSVAAEMCIDLVEFSRLVLFLPCNISRMRSTEIDLYDQIIVL